MVINEITVKEVWKQLDAGDTPYKIGGITKPNKISESTTAVSPKTAQRLKTALIGFREDNASDEDISERTEWSISRVKMLRCWYKNYSREEYQSIEWKCHIQNLLEIAGRIRDRIYDPDISEQLSDDESAWFIGGQDWRLRPHCWIELVRPPLDYGRWNKDFEKLREHIGSNSLFCQRYEKINAEANKLTEEILSAAEELKETTPGFGEKWDLFEMYTDDYYLVHLKPNKIRVMPKEHEIVPLTYPWEDNNKVFELFAEKTPKLNSKLKSIEQLLQELWDCLDLNIIGPLIEQGTCSECPK